MAKTLCDPNAPYPFKVGDVVTATLGPRAGNTFGKIIRINAANVVFDDYDKGMKRRYMRREKIKDYSDVSANVVAEREAQMKPSSPRKPRSSQVYEGGLHSYMDRVNDAKSVLVAMSEAETISKLEKISKKYNKALVGIDDRMSDETKAELTAYQIQTSGVASDILKSAHGYCKLLLRRARQAIKGKTRRVKHEVVHEQHASM